MVQWMSLQDPMQLCTLCEKSRALHQAKLVSWQEETKRKYKFEILKDFFIFTSLALEGNVQPG